MRGNDEQQKLTLAVLSPYNQQVARINKDFRNEWIARSGLIPKQPLRNRVGIAETGSQNRVAHSVDSFQGNQAAVIAVSLVRNNELPIGQGLGFLDEAPRMNVLLSRAERLLILVGSWEFFERQLSAVSLDDPHLPQWHWRKVLTTLDTWFKSGRALRIDGRTQGGAP